MYNITINILTEREIPLIVEAFKRGKWPKPATTFELYLKEQQQGERIIWAAKSGNEYVGYVTLKWRSSYQLFAENNIPEIIDLNILPQFRDQGTGTKLLEVAEQAATQRSEVVGLGVGLYGGADGGYGAAQRLYVKRGYIPNGKGVTYSYQAIIPGNSYPIDDDLVLWFTKKLK